MAQVDEFGYTNYTDDIANYDYNAATGTPAASGTPAAAAAPTRAPIVSVFTDPNTGDQIAIDANGQQTVLFKGTIAADKEAAEKAQKAAEQAQRQSAYDLLLTKFTEYGLASLVTPLKDLILNGASPAEFTLQLRETEAYKKRFAGNAQRIANGFTAISEAEYLDLEDSYQSTMARYGLPADYWSRDDIGTQSGFTQLIANNISGIELEERVLSAQQRVLNSNPEILKALKEFYPEISDGDILAYNLDPKNAIEKIKLKITAAEIGGAAMAEGLSADRARAEMLSAAGINKSMAQQGFQTVANISPRATQLSEMYGGGEYGQAEAEQEVFNLPGGLTASNKRRKLIETERASFQGSSGVSQLGRDKVPYGGQTNFGAGQY
jgi:hypothetical protein